MRLHDKTYDFVIPFGHTCAAAMYASERGFRTCSLPLDWVGTGYIGFKATAGYVLNGFKDFLVPERLEPWDPFKNIPPDVYHDFYWDKTNQLVFIHDFRKGIPLSEESPVVKERYERRIKRLYGILESPAKKLLFCWTHDEHPSVESLTEAMSSLRQRFPKGDVDLLYMESVKDMEGIETVPIAPGVTLVRGYFYNPAKGMTMGDCDLTNSVLRKISLKGLRKELFKRSVWRFLFRLRAALELNSEKRHQLRKKIRDNAWGR